VVVLVKLVVLVVILVVLVPFWGWRGPVSAPVVPKVSSITTNTPTYTVITSNTYTTTSTSKTNTPTNRNTTSHLSTIYTTKEAEKVVGSNWFGIYIASTLMGTLFTRGYLKGGRLLWLH